jgi:hypothetical protein
MCALIRSVVILRQEAAANKRLHRPVFMLQRQAQGVAEGFVQASAVDEGKDQDAGRRQQPRARPEHCCCGEQNGGGGKPQGMGVEPAFFSGENAADGRQGEEQQRIGAHPVAEPFRQGLW